MTGVSLKVDLTDTTTPKFSALIAASTDMTPLMDAIGAGLVTSTQLRFELGVSPDGTPWEISIRAREEGGQTLIDRGFLRDSMTHDPDRTSLVMGTNVIYAALMQVGGTIKAKNAPRLTFKIGDRFVSKEEVTVPARPFVGLSALDEVMISEGVDAYVDRVLQ